MGNENQPDSHMTKAREAFDTLHAEVTRLEGQLEACAESEETLCIERDKLLAEVGYLKTPFEGYKRPHLLGAGNRNIALDEEHEAEIEILKNELATKQMTISEQEARLSDLTREVERISIMLKGLGI